MVNIVRRLVTGWHVMFSSGAIALYVPWGVIMAVKTVLIEPSILSVVLLVAVLLLPALWGEINEPNRT